MKIRCSYKKRLYLYVYQKFWQGWFVGAAASSTGMKKTLELLERGKDLLQNGILNFTISLSQSPVIAFQCWNLHW